VATLAEIEAILPTLSPDELARVEALLHRLGYNHHSDARFDGRSWSASPAETNAELDQIDRLPPLLSPEEADRFNAWLANERERQKALAKSGSAQISKLFS
jgi:hypothetical protein